MTDVFWLAQTEANVPAENNWLAEGETLRLSGMRFAKRRADWRLGRWTAKRAVVTYLGLPADAPSLARIEIRAAASGAPEVLFVHRPAGVSISLSHRAGTAVCAVAAADAALGCDLELIEPRSYAFVADYFTAEEQAALGGTSAADRPRLIALVWSAKESALKALQTGLRLDTRCVEVDAGEASRSRSPRTWRPLFVRCAGGHLFQGWWQQTGDFLVTLVAAPAPAAPTLLKVA